MIKSRITGALFIILGVLFFISGFSFMIDGWFKLIASSALMTIGIIIFILGLALTTGVKQ